MNGIFQKLVYYYFYVQSVYSQATALTHFNIKTLRFFYSEFHVNSASGTEQKISFFALFTAPDASQLRSGIDDSNLQDVG